jgi:hypothetical protein
MAIIRFIAGKLHLTGKFDLDQIKWDTIVKTDQELNEQYFQAWFSSGKN